MDYINFALNLIIWVVGVTTVAKYIVFWIVKGVIKFNFLKCGQKIQTIEYKYIKR